MRGAADPGRIDALLRTSRLEQVSPDMALARRLLDDAARHLATAPSVLEMGDLPGAYQLAYDALRKSAAALLAARGLRATSRGGHVAVQDGVSALFGSAVPALRSFSRVRRARNSYEYPSSDTTAPDAAAVDDAITVARTVHDAATAILDDAPSGDPS
jgi:uncharacterized protein (UPF0332 family)